MKLLERSWAPWLVLAIAFVLGLATIQMGFYVDDHPIRAALQGHWPGGPRAWDLYRFAPGDEAGNRAEIAAGALPWWTSPFLKLHLIRPLASLTFALDEKLFGASPIGWHLHSIAWYLLLVLAVWRVLEPLLPRATATLALLVYAMSTAHLFPYGWIACRHMVVAAAFGMLGLGSLVRGHRHGQWHFALGLAAGLAGGETALGVAAFGVIYMFVSTRRQDLFARLAPTTFVLLSWIACYIAVGGGAAHSDGYVDPMSAPGRFGVKAVTMLPIMVANATFGTPAELASIVPVAPLMALGAIATAFLAAMWRGSAPAMADDERRALPWLVVAAVLALAPSVGGFPGARVLLVPNVAFSALVAVCIRRGFARIPDASAVSRVARAAGAGLLVLVHVVAAPLVDLGNAAFNAKVGRQLESLSMSVDVGTDAQPSVRMFVVGASDPLVTLYPPLVMLAGSPKHRERLSCWSILEASKQAHRLTRTSERELLLRPASGPLLRGPFESLFRSKTDPFRAGDEVRQCGVVYRIESVVDGLPNEVRTTFDVPLEDPSIRFVRWNGERFVPLELPRVGEHVEIPWSAGPIGAF